MHPSKTDSFLIISCDSTYWKNGTYENADNGIDLLANATGSIGLNKKTEKNPQNEGKKRKNSRTTGTKKPDW